MQLVRGLSPVLSSLVFSESAREVWRRSSGQERARVVITINQNNKIEY